MDNVYAGFRDARGAHVLKNGKLLTAARSMKVYSHADQFEWGYAGSGPAQLALALLLEEGIGEALALHQRFKFYAIVHLKKDEWTINGEFICDWVAHERAEAECDTVTIAEEKPHA